MHILLLLVEFRNFMNSEFELKLKLTWREEKGNMKFCTVLHRGQGRCFIILDHKQHIMKHFEIFVFSLLVFALVSDLVNI